MTLILEVHDPKEQASLFISDCLVTDLYKKNRKESRFPLHASCDWNIDTRGSSIVSKIITSDDRFIMCAGGLDNILRVSEQFHSTSSDVVKFREYLDSLYATGPKTEQFIYGYNGTEPIQSADSYCHRFSVGHLDICCGGTGGQYVSQMFKDMVPDPKQDIFSLTIQALAIIIRQEFVDYDFPEHYFGGAYEMAYQDKEGLKRIPYTVLDFSADSKISEDGVPDILLDLPQRMVLSVPTPVGSVFTVFGPDFDPATVRHFPAFEPEKNLPENSKLWTTRGLLDSFKPVFDLVLVRSGSGVGWRIGKDLVEFRPDGELMQLFINRENIQTSLESQNAPPSPKPTLK